MQKKPDSRILIIVCIGIVCGMVLSPRFLYNKDKPCYIVNPGEKNVQGFWSRTITGNEVALWADSRGLVLKHDLPPYIDNIAGVPHPGGTVLTFSNLCRNSFYTFFIDLVDFHNKHKLKLDTRLLVIIEGASGQRSTVRTVSFHDTINMPLAVHIPYRFSAGGSIRVILRESGASSGAWAVWDCYLLKKGQCSDK